MKLKILTPLTLVTLWAISSMQAQANCSVELDPNLHPNHCPPSCIEDIHCENLDRQGCRYAIRDEFTKDPKKEGCMQLCTPATFDIICVANKGRVPKTH